MNRPASKRLAAAFAAAGLLLALLLPGCGRKARPEPRFTERPNRTQTLS